MKNKITYTRKEVAQIISNLLGEDYSTDRLRRNEKAFGLKPVRINARVIRFSLADIAKIREKLKIC